MKWNFIKASVLYLATMLVVAGNASEVKAVEYGKNLISEANQDITSVESMTYFLENRNLFSILNDIDVVQDKDIKEVTVTSETGEEVKIAKSTTFELKEEVSSYKEMLKHVAVVTCEDKVNVRSSATTEEENIVGKAYNNAIVIIEDVVEAEDGIWYQITSGNVEGYIRGDKLITGKEARAIAESMVGGQAVVDVDTLNLRAEASLDCEVIGVLLKGDVCTIEESAENGFVKVTTSLGEVGYVAESYLTIQNNFEWAFTLEEYEQKLEEEAATQALQQAQVEAETIKSLMADAYANYLDQLNAEWFRNAQGYAEEYVSRAQELLIIGEYYGLEDIVAYANEAIENGNSYIATAQAKIAEVENQLAAEEAEAAAKAAAEQAQREAAAKAQAEAEARAKAEAAAKAAANANKNNTSSSSSTTVATNVSAIRQAIVAEAIKWPGKCNYVWGGTNLTVGGGVDCSGFTLSIYKKVAGITLNRTSAAQSQMGRRIALSAVQPGDLVFYYGGSGIGHVAIYIGNGQIVHAKNPSAGIGIDSMYYTQPAWAISLF